MYYLSHSKTRVVFGNQLDITVKTALTKWGKRRTEKFFARFLYENKSRLKCEMLHPFAAIRYAIIEFLINYNLISINYEQVISSSPLLKAERHYLIWAFPPPDSLIFPGFRRELMEEASERLRLVVMALEIGLRRNMMN